MTSFIIKSHEDRAIASSWEVHPDCPFCRIVRGEAPAFRLYEDDLMVAFLDILPLRLGHTLIVPKVHHARVSELPPEFAAAVGMAVSKVARALTEALQNTALNVVCNQEYAQVVPHVHYHVIPAPKLGGSDARTAAPDPGKVDHVVKPLTQEEMHKKEFEFREELDVETANDLVAKIRARL